MDFTMVFAQDEQGGFVQLSTENPRMLLPRPNPTVLKGPDEVQIAGTVGWGRDDRISGRYGGIQLSAGHANVNLGETSPVIGLSSLTHFYGKRVTVSALVTVARKSYHDGDLYRGYKPRVTPVGTTVELGTGIVMALEDLYGSETLIFCREERLGFPDCWMDPELLYALHDHDVVLTVKAA